MWGEPYDRCDIIRSLARSLLQISDEYPPDHFLATRKIPGDASEPGPLSERWIANLYPDLHHLIAAHRAFFEALFGGPAEALGYSRWGVKEVRLGIEYARYLKLLFPNARFLFLHRNPYEAYRSFRPHRGWYDMFPDRPVLTPRQFAHHWTRLCEGFVEGWRSVDGFLLSYERLTEDESCIRELEDHFELRLNRDVLRRRVGSTRELSTERVPAYELRAVARVVKPLASALGYRLPGTGR